jgi:O-antigen ligase
MALVVLSEQRPLEALASIFRRCAYVLIPLSIVLIRYYPEMGRAYHVWTGVEMWTGVATHKNGLGQLCAISAFFLIWSLGLGKANEVRASPIQRMADVSVLLMACYLLIGPGQGAYSATSLGILAAGVGTLLTLRCTPRVATALATHGGVLVITLVLGYALLGDVVTATVSALFGRDGNLTGRTVEIWPYAWEIGARHPILGAGYGGVWGLGGDISLKTGVEQAHNGYLDVYLELGIVGLLFLGAYFLNLCGTVRRAFRCDVNWGLFGLCFVLMTLIYNISETAFFDVYLGASMLLVTMTLSVAAAPGVATAGVRRQSVPAFTGCDVRGN